MFLSAGCKTLETANNPKAIAYAIESSDLDARNAELRKQIASLKEQKSNLETAVALCASDKDYYNGAKHSANLALVATQLASAEAEIKRNKKRNSEIKSHVRDLAAENVRESGRPKPTEVGSVTRPEPCKPAGTCGPCDH